MTNIGEDQSTTLPRRQLGRYLKDARLAVGLKLEDVAPLMQWSASKLSRIESGKSPAIRVLDVEALCRIYEIDDPEVSAGLLGLAKQSTGTSWWQAFDDVISGNFDLYVGLESSAQQLSMFQPHIVAGLLQTPAYARAVEQGYYSDISEQELERRIQLRIKRQSLLNRKFKPVAVDFVIHESALWTVVGNGKVMAAQCHHLANLPVNVEVRVLPYDAGFPAGLPTGPFAILDFGTDSKGRETSPTVVYVELYAGDLYLERRKDVARYRQAYSATLKAALDVPDSKRRLRQIAREHER
ncbi:helix-turn-helix transcriptional regulator [Nocardia sp. NPDC052254]|uniref:helix-turn-helix domain-containing protein n=1 Tax=Nocardia sp. NPDC052254 TaxID=3155681 RepID=UPI00342947B7